MKINYKTVTYYLLFFAAAFLAVYLFEGYGIIGILVFVFGLAAFTIWKGRQMIILTMKDAETKIWGKPLDKELWEKEEMKHTKVRIRWKKKKPKNQ